MRTRALLSAALLTFLLQTTVAYGQWVQLGPAGPITSIAARGSSTYAGLNIGGGVFVSTNGGASWKQASSGLPVLSVTALAVTAEKVYVGLAGEGIWASTDGGTTWNDAGGGLISNDVIVIAPVGGVLFAGSGTFGASRSTDGGTMWFPSGRGFATGSASAFMGVGTRVFGASTSGGVYVSMDGGDNWSQSNAGMTTTAVTSLASFTTMVFAGTLNKGVFRSTDNGASWTVAGSGLPNNLVVALATVTPASGSPTLVAAMGSGLFSVSTDSGSSWATVDPGLAHKTIGTLIANGTTLFAGTGDGILVSTDGGFHWGASNAGITTAQVTGIVSLGGVLHVGTESGGILSTTNGGSVWTRNNNGLSSLEISALTRGNGVTFAGTSSAVFALPDTGSTWTARPGLPGEVNTVRQIGAVLYAGSGGQGIYSSTNAGTTWRFGSGSVWDLAGTIVQSFGPGVGLVMAGTSGRGILGSASAGLDWFRTNGGLANMDILGFATIGQKVFAATGDGPYSLTTGAEDWTPSTTGFGSNSATAIEVYQEKLIAGTRSGGVYVSVDQGANWAAVNNGLLVPSVNTVVIDSPYVYVGTNGGGVYRRQLAELFTSLAVDGDRQLPVGFRLGQNYPNPFNPVSVIPFEIGVSGSGPVMVRISVYDVLGREVAVLVNEPRGPGRYTVPFAGNAFASGVYLCRMDVGGNSVLFRDMKKMLLLR